MNLTGFDLFRYRLPLREPLTLKGVTLHRREGLLLRLCGDDGSEGWGETAPLPGFSGEVMVQAIVQLRRLAGSLIGRDIGEVWAAREGAFVPQPERIGPAPSVRFGLELAIWNLYAVHFGLDLPGLVSPSPKKEVPVNGLIPGPPANVVEEARRMSDAGYRSIKLKVGARPIAEEIGLVRALGGELGGDVSLRLDANRAWGYGAAAEFIRGVAEIPLEYIEEPLAEPALLGDLVQEFGVPVAIDETLVGMRQDSLEDHRYARAVVLKPTLLGGVWRTLRMAERALRLGMVPVLSSAYESGVGTAALVALAAGLGGRPIPTGLDAYRALAEDVLDSPLALPAPRVDVGQTMYASRKVEAGRLEKL